MDTTGCRIFFFRRIYSNLFISIFDYFVIFLFHFCVFLLFFFLYRNFFTKLFCVKIVANSLELFFGWFTFHNWVKYTYTHLHMFYESLFVCIPDCCNYFKLLFILPLLSAWFVSFSCRVKVLANRSYSDSTCVQANNIIVNYMWPCF